MKQTIKSPIEVYEMLNKIKADDLKSCESIINYISTLESRLRQFETLVDSMMYNIEKVV